MTINDLEEIASVRINLVRGITTTNDTVRLNKHHFSDVFLCKVASISLLNFVTNLLYKHTMNGHGPKSMALLVAITKQSGTCQRNVIIADWTRIDTSWKKGFPLFNYYSFHLLQQRGRNNCRCGPVRNLRECHWNWMATRRITAVE